jgi:hypothetical protein
MLGPNWGQQDEHQQSREGNSQRCQITSSWRQSASDCTKHHAPMMRKSVMHALRATQRSK